MGGIYGVHGETSNAYTILVGKPEGKRLLLEDIIKMDLKQGMGMWTGFIWFRVGSSDELFQTTQRPFGFHKGRGMS
jgi:hypothetical protein